MRSSGVRVPCGARRPSLVQCGCNAARLGRDQFSVSESQRRRVMSKQNGSAAAAVYVQTNDAAENEVLAFERGADGRLAPLGRFATGGRGTGKPHLPSQSSIVLSGDGRQLLVVNAGSDELSLFAVEGGRPGARRSRRLRRRDADQRRGQRRSRLRPQQRQPEHRRVQDRRRPARRAGGLGSAAERRRRRSGSGRLQPRRPHSRRDRARDGQHQRVRHRRARLRRRPDDDRVVREDAVWVRLHRRTAR